jgi:glycosyltransferase involved in cell wall biosynthesis
MSAGNAPPTLSIGLAVRNEPRGVRRCIESVLAQDFTDLELVICDNASDDDTVETVNEFAREDRRVSVAVHPVNIGSHENMNRVLELSRGTLFRWISADDWLEPKALSEGVRALNGHPEAVGVTTGFTIHSPDRAPRYEQYRGEFPSSADPSRRFERMLWFFHARETTYDPVYGIYRREQLMRSSRIRPNERTDWLLSAELALMGPIVHIHDLLAHRGKTYPASIDRAAFRRRLDPCQGEGLKTSATALTGDLSALARSANLTESQLRRCRRALWRFWLLEVKRTNRRRMADAVRRVLPR